VPAGDGGKRGGILQKKAVQKGPVIAGRNVTSRVTAESKLGNGEERI